MNKRIRDILEFICIFAIAFGVVFLAINLTLDYRSKKALEEIRGGIKAARIQSEQIVIPDEAKALNEKKASDEGTTVDSTDGPTKVIDSHGNDASVVAVNPILQEYDKLFKENSDFAGWIYVDGTEIDYPYMQGPDNEFYLSHNIERTYDKYGMLIMDVNCSLENDSPQMIVYGHNVNTGKLFGELLKYKEEAYFGYHPTINFDTVRQTGEYEIFAVFLTTVSEAQNEQRLFTTWGFDNKEEFSRVTNWAKEKSLYDTGVIPEYGKPILTLVTCEHSRDEGRFVVMATKK